MCEIRESEAMSRRLESLEAEVERLRDNARFTDRSTDLLLAENDRFRAEIDHLKAVAAARERLLAEGMACIEWLMAEVNRLRGRKALDPADKAAILAHVRSCAGPDAAPAGGEGGD